MGLRGLSERAETWYSVSEKKRAPGFQRNRLHDRVRANDMGVPRDAYASGISRPRTGT